MHVQYQFLAAMEYDQLRTAPRRHGIEEARRDHAARLTREQVFGTGRGMTRAFGRGAFGRRAFGAAA